MDRYTNSRATGAFIVIDRLNNITVGAGMVTQIGEVQSTDARQQFSQFEIEFNALIRKRFPHWDAKTIL